MPQKPTYEELRKRILELEHVELERKRVEEELAQIFSMSLDMICIADINNATFSKVNQAFTDILGYSEEELLEKSFLDFIHPDDIDATVAVINQELRSGTKVINFENRYRCKGGNYRWLSWVSHPDPKKGVTFALARDITDWKNAEDALKKSKVLLDSTGRMAKVGGWELNPNTMEVNWTKETYRIHEVPFDQRPPLEKAINYFHPEDRPKLERAIQRAIDFGEPYDMELRFITAKEKHLWTRTICKPEIISGKVNKLIGTFQDITEAKQAEEILHQSHQMLKRTEAMANIGSWEWDVKYDRTYWSEELFRIFGLDPTGDAPSFAEQSELYANGDMQRLKYAVEKCVKQGMPYEIELRAVRPNGEIRHCVSKGQPQYDENGNVFSLTGSFQDITDRKHSENHIRALERRNQALLDHSPVCHKIVDLDFNLRYMSANGFKMLKIDENSEVYRKPYPFYFFPEAFQSKMKKKLREVMDTGETVTMEALANDFQGNEVWLDSSLIPIFDDEHNIEYLTVVSANITQRKISEKEKARLEGQLHQAQKMEAVGRLAGGVAHDFNNMLNVILGHTEMAMEDVSTTHPINQRLEEVKKAGLRSADLTRQLLAFARKQTVSPKVIDLNKTLDNMSSMLNRLIGEDIDIAWRLNKSVWPMKIDPSQIDQILANLCVNARDAIADVGKVTIETGNTTFDETYCNDHPGFKPGEYVLLAVSDNGCGMDNETLDNIFEPFFTTKESGKGTGLGLATVYGVVKQNNGFINVYSEPGQGTTFKIYLPRYQSKGEVIPNEVDNLPTKQGHETILLVEDEIAILNVTAQMLQRLGYEVITAKTPGEAIHLSQEYQGNIHLLVTDVVMPEMNGRDLAKKILSFYPSLKRLFMSGYTANVIAHHGILDEGVNFIQKPFSKEQLSVKLREVLDRDE